VFFYFFSYFFSCKLCVIILLMADNIEKSELLTDNKTSPLIPIEELERRLHEVSVNYFLRDLRKDRESYYALTYEEIVRTQSWFCFSGLTLNLIMDGKLEEAWHIIESLPEDKGFFLKLLKIGLTIVHPEITWKQFVSCIEYLKSINTPLKYVMLTAGRPLLLNGFNDFSRLGPLLLKHREMFVDYLKYLYPESLCPYIYNLCLAEYYYQTNSLVDAAMLVGSTVKKFNIEGENRIIFAALYLQSRILLAHGKSVRSESFIQDIRNCTGEAGKAEFDYNIDAVSVLFSLYEGNIARVKEWLSGDAPDEFADFNLLDLYRYMVKMRCYIATRKYAAVIALAERLRPYLAAGRRFMDLCEQDLILALSLFAAKNNKAAFEALRNALKKVRMYRYYRLVADEGEPMLHLLIEYIKTEGKSPFLMNLLDMTRSMAIRHPLYMKVPCQKGDGLTQMEIDILTLLEQGKSKEEIAEYFFISVNTVKYHIKNVYVKLGVKTATQAVWNARILGII